MDGLKLLEISLQQILGVGRLDYVQHLQSLNSGTEVGGAHKMSSINKVADFEALIFGGFCLESEGGFLSVPRREMRTSCSILLNWRERALKTEPLLFLATDKVGPMAGCQR